jgi:hypothetical protein
MLFRHVPWSKPRSESSHASVWVEHDSDGGSHGSCWEVLGETSSDSTVVAVGVDDSAPHNSKSSIVDGVAGLVNVGHSPALVEPGTGDVVAVLDGEQSLAGSGEGLGSSEAGEDGLLVQSHGLGLVDTPSSFFLGRLDFLCHSSLFL